MVKMPRLVISGLSGGSGKTLATLGLARHLARSGTAVQGFKKGPDYIDNAWLAFASKNTAACLDPFFLDGNALKQQFFRACRASRASLALIEGNRGLYDGRDASGSCSTAHVARILEAPVILALNCAKMTRTAAAIVSGMASFEPGINLAGVIINNVAGQRHASMVRQCIESGTGIPVLGVIPRLQDNPLPERHLGLAMQGAQAERESLLERLADIAAECMDIQALLRIAGSAPPLPDLPPGGEHAEALPSAPRIGYVYDDALWFYYSENLESLRQAGAKLVRLSILDPSPWPELDGLYLGGGYPEMHAKAISSSPHLAEIRALSLKWRPIYAECGGMMILAHSLRTDGGIFPMAGLLPLHIQFCEKPQSLGYVEAKTIRDNPFHPAGSVWRGHEFHYSRCVWTGKPPECCMELASGKGMYEKNGKQFDGICLRRTFACWTHLFAPSVPHWAQNFISAAVR